MGRILPGFAYHFINFEPVLLVPTKAFFGCRICKGRLSYQSRVCKFIAILFDGIA